MTVWGIRIGYEINLGDLIVALVPVAALLINIVVFRRYRSKPAVPLSEPDIKLIRNERAKLSASWANTIATGFLAAGFFPAVAALVKVAEGSGHPDWPFVLAGLSLTPFAFLLHLIGRFLLKGLRA